MSILASGRSSFNIIFRASERSTRWPQHIGIRSRTRFAITAEDEAQATPMESNGSLLDLLLSKLAGPEARMVLALAQALIDHPEWTLNSKEIDAVIAVVAVPTFASSARSNARRWRKGGDHEYSDSQQCRRGGVFADRPDATEGLG